MKLGICLAVFLAFQMICPVATDAAFWSRGKSSPVRSFESGDYLVLYSVDKPAVKSQENHPERLVLSYKLVFLREDKPVPGNVWVEVGFLDDNGFTLVRDVVSDNDFNRQGECYGHFPIEKKKSQRIQSATIRILDRPPQLLPGETEQGEFVPVVVAGPAVVEKVQPEAPAAPVPVIEDNVLKILIPQNIITNEVIQSTLKALEANDPAPGQAPDPATDSPPPATS